MVVISFSWEGWTDLRKVLKVELKTSVKKRQIMEENYFFYLVLISLLFNNLIGTAGSVGQLKEITLFKYQ